MTRTIFLSALAILAFSAACDVPADLAAAQQAADLTAKNRDLAEQFVKDIKKGFAPEDQRYKDTRTLYERAQASTNSYVGLVVTSVLANDTAAVLTVPAEAAHAAQAEFIKAATQTLNPTLQDSKLISFGLIMEMLPPLAHKVMAAIETRQRLAAVRKFSAAGHWRSWDEL